MCPPVSERMFFFFFLFRREAVLGDALIAHCLVSGCSPFAVSSSSYPSYCHQLPTGRGGSPLLGRRRRRGHPTAGDALADALPVGAASEHTVGVAGVGVGGAGPQAVLTLGRRDPALHGGQLGHDLSTRVHGVAGQCADLDADGLGGGGGRNGADERDEEHSRELHDDGRLAICPAAVCRWAVRWWGASYRLGGLGPGRNAQQPARASWDIS